jgi:hemerythrin
MAIINWSSNLSVKIDKIDNQHKKLISMINELHDAMKAGQANDIIGKILNDLINYTAEHFKTEEDLMIKFKYPDYNQHKIEHTKFVQEVNNIKKDLEAQKMMLSLKVMNFLKDWLSNHIMKSDQKYSNFFNTNGVN